MSKTYSNDAATSAAVNRSEKGEPFNCVNVESPDIGDVDTADLPLCDDLISGVPAISKFIGDSPRRVYYLLANRRIPAGKVGGRWVASKSVLRRYYARLTGGDSSREGG